MPRSLVETILKYLLEEIKENGEAEFKRNQLAERFNCVPSQINYVLERNFKMNEQFTVEIKRGQGGYIRIKRAYTWVEPQENNWTVKQCFHLLEHAFKSGMISEREMEYMKIAIFNTESEIKRKEIMNQWFILIKRG
jgi:transcriptional regulator CtsR